MFAVDVETLLLRSQEALVQVEEAQLAESKKGPEGGPSGQVGLGENSGRFVFASRKASC